MNHLENLNSIVDKMHKDFEALKLERIKNSLDEIKHGQLDLTINRFNLTSPVRNSIEIRQHRLKNSPFIWSILFYLGMIIIGVIIGANHNQFGKDSGAIWFASIFILVFIVLGFLATKKSLSKKELWSFNHDGVEIKKWMGKTQYFKKADIQEIFVEEKVRKTKTGNHLTYWVVLKVYNAVKLRTDNIYLINAGGKDAMSTSTLYPDVARTMEDENYQIATIIAQYWNIPLIKSNTKN
jgi:hypothetical protein